MKKLIIINGTIGVGKSTISKVLLDNCNKSILLDGDWAWYQGNSWDFSNENKKMALDNIKYLLLNFFKNNNFQNIIFCWVILKKEYFNEIINYLKNYYGEFEVYFFTLKCNASTLQLHLEKRMKNRNGIYEESVMKKLCLDSLIKQEKLYMDNSFIIDVDQLTCDEIIKIILNQVGLKFDNFPNIIKH